MEYKTLPNHNCHPDAVECCDECLELNGFDVNENKVVMEKRLITLPNNEEILITFTDEGIVYDRLDKYGEVVETYGYDFYSEIKPLADKLCQN